jgi:hypothetical protein
MATVRFLSLIVSSFAMLVFLSRPARVDLIIIGPFTRITR